MEKLDVIVKSGELKDRAVVLDMTDLPHRARPAADVLFYDGKYVETLAPGLYAFWRNTANAKVVEYDLRETMLDMAGQELMTADKVTLCMNAVITYRIADAPKAASVADDVRQPFDPGLGLG